MSNDKEIIKRLLAIATKQQKIITKLAQAASGDPLEGLDMSPPPATNSAPAAKPAPAAAKPAATTPAAKPAATNAPAGLPTDLKAALDSVPGLKGALLVTVDGNRVDVKYNSDKVKAGATDLKNKLTQAFGGNYSVSNILGYMNPDWKPNY